MGLNSVGNNMAGFCVAIGVAICVAIGLTVVGPTVLEIVVVGDHMV